MVYKYTWNLSKGKKRFEGITHGSTWAEALSNILEYHPKRTSIEWVKSFEIGRMGEEPDVGEEEIGNET